MRNSKIHKVLANKVPAINDKLFMINHGGCGRSAVEIYSALRRYGVNSSIVLVNEPYNEESVIRLIERTGKHDINSAYQHIFKNVHDFRGDTLNGHVCVKFDGRLYDSDGEFDGKAISEHITVKTMEKFLTYDMFWNDQFKWANRRNKSIIRTMQSFYNNLFSKHLTS